MSYENKQSGNIQFPLILRFFGENKEEKKIMMRMREKKKKEKRERRKETEEEEKEKTFIEREAIKV